MLYKNKKNNLSKNPPNFLKGFDGFDFVQPKIKELKKDWRHKLIISRKIIKQQEQKIIKPFHNLEKSIWQHLERQHCQFDKALVEKGRELKKIRLQFLSINQKKPAKLSANWQLNWYRSLFSFFLVLLFLVVPFKILAYLQVFNISQLEQKIFSSSKSAINNLMGAEAAASRFDLSLAQNHFASAGQDFFQASEDMAVINDTLLSLAALSSNPKIKLAAESKKFLKLGIIGSDLGANLAQALAGLSKNDGNWIKILDDFSIYGRLALDDARKLKTEIKKIDINNLPLEYQGRFTDLATKADTLPDNLSLALDNVAELKTFLGAGRDKRYLLVFQNNAEMRGSGGFLGSYALVDFREGKIRNLEVPGGGSYDTEAGLTEKIKAPAPLQLVNPQWHFWDANWWPDWPTTAKNLMWFYEKSDGPSVDGVISFTPSVVEKLLEITGPIDLVKDYGLVISADNFWQQVELTAERDNVIKSNPAAVAHLPQGESAKPKKIIGELMAKILEILPQKLDKNNLIKLLSIGEDSLASKQILFYFKDSELEKTVLEHNWGGAMLNAPMDYLMVTNTNIAGAKTDRVIKETINQETTIASDGSIINKLTITRTHTAAKNAPLFGVRNVDWIRVYVPLGSKLLSASGFVSPDLKYFESPDSSWLSNKFISETEDLALIDEGSGTKMYTENGKTVFANWLMLDPGSSATLTLVYKLPFNLWQKEVKTDFFNRLNKWLSSDNKDLYPYSLAIQKQPGAENETLSTKLILPDKTNLIWNTENFPISDQALSRDNFYSVLISTK